MSELANLSQSIADFLNARARVQAKFLSGGQRQLLALAISVLGRPKLILLDEHLASLDVTHVEAADKLIMNAMNQNRMMILAASHNKAWVNAHCKRAINLAVGAISNNG